MVCSVYMSPHDGSRDQLCMMQLCFFEFKMIRFFLLQSARWLTWQRIVLCAHDEAKRLTTMFCAPAQVCLTGPIQTCSRFPSRGLPLSPSPTTQGPGEPVRLHHKTSHWHYMWVHSSSSDWISCLSRFFPLSSPGASPSLSPVTSPSHSPLPIGVGSSSSLVTRSPVEFPDTADFLTKPSVSLNLHKPLGYTLSSPDFQQAFRSSTLPLCTRWDLQRWSVTLLCLSCLQL